jgi:hypothetical protein
MAFLYKKRTAHPNKGNAVRLFILQLSEIDYIPHRHIAAQCFMNLARAVTTERAAELNLVHRAAFYKLASAGTGILDAVYTHHDYAAGRLLYLGNVL